MAGTASGAAGGGRRKSGGRPGAGVGVRGAARAGGLRPTRFLDYPRWGKQGWRRWMPSWKQLAGVCVVFAGALLGLVGLAYAMVGVPDPNAAAQTQKNVYYWADGSRMVVSGGGDLNRQVVPLAQIPQSVQNAVISAENTSFYSDSGVDPQGIARAILKMAEGGETQSGSTITQQYVKNTYLDQSQTITRKFKELLISVKVGATQSKQKILAGYLNTAYYGRGAYGVQAAAQAYYGVNAQDLKPDQSAFLAALINGPNIYDPAGGVGPGATPSENLARGTARWSWILDREVATGHMTQAERNQYKTFPMPQPPKPSEDQGGQIGYLVNLADNYVIANSGISKEMLDKGGYSIYTTFIRKNVDALQKAVQAVSEASINPILRPNTDKYVQFGGASIKPGDGAIVAIYGGEDYLKHFTDNADYTGAQVGSTFKPFVLAAAMRDGVRNPQGGRTPVSPDSMYPGLNNWKVLNYDGSVWQDSHGNQWLQKNDNNDNFKTITLKNAMERSVNSTYVQLGMDVGLDKVKQAALDAGIDESSFADTNVPSFSIGTSAPSAIRMANAYGTFANHGTAVEPYSVTKVVQSDNGDVIFQHQTQPKALFTPAVADNVTGVLQGVVQDGTGTYAKNLGRPAAGKTGTTDSNKSAWFTGYTPQLSTSIGMYRMDDQSKNPQFLPMYGVGGMQKVFGASFPTEIWTDYMKTALAGQPSEPFAPAPSIGQKVNGPGVSSSPSASAAPSTAPGSSSSAVPTAPPAGPSPTPTDPCGFFGCNNGGGNGGGTGTGGNTAAPTTGTSSGGTKSSGNGGGGGLLGGMG
jgi:membrane peptidoglycan carboxypeptidase